MEHLAENQESKLRTLCRKGAEKCSRMIGGAYSFIQERSWLKLLLMFGFFLVSFDIVYFSVNSLISSDDHFFHFQFALQMREHGFFKTFRDFTAIYFSKSVQTRSYFIYHNFLFYLVLLPFTFITPLFLAIKLYAILAASLVFTTLYYALEKFKVRYAFLWTFVIFAFTADSSIWRFLLSRPYAFAPAFLMVIAVAVFKKKPLWVFALSFLYVFWHSATFFFPIIVVVPFLIFEALYGRKVSWKALWATCGGILLACGLCYLLKSNFFLYSYENIFQIYVDTILGNKVNIQEGAELYPIDLFGFVRNNIIIFTMMILALATDIASYVHFRNSDEEREETETKKDLLVARSSFLFLSLGFFLGSIAVSERFNDFYVFFVGIYVALAFDNLKDFFSINETYLRKALTAGMVVVAIYISFVNFVLLESTIGSGGAAPETFSGVGSWLTEHTEKGDIVFNVDWGWFTKLYYYDPTNNYIIGLEPRFLYNYNPTLYWLWQHIGQNGYACGTEDCSTQDLQLQIITNNKNRAYAYYQAEGDQIADVITKDFKSNYIVTSNDYTYLNNVLSNSSRFTKVYTESNFYYIYKIGEATTTLKSK